MNIFDEVLKNLLGNYNLAFYISSFIFVGIGLIVSLRFSANKRNPDSLHTPNKFNWGFLLRDNILRIISSLAFIFAMVRFGEDITGRVPNEIGAFMLGLGFDQAIALVEKWSKKARQKWADKQSE